MSADASDGIDWYDAPEPPSIGEYVSVFLNLGFTEQKYSTDFRRAGLDGYQFRFTVRGNSNDMREIYLSPINLPDQLDWTVISEQTQINYQKNTIQSSLQSSDYVLLVGSADYINQNTLAYQEIPSRFTLQQNYPNPFNPETYIKFQIPENQHISIKIYDILGRHVKTIMENELKPAGYYEINWDGKNKLDNSVASGIYLLNLNSENYSKTIKMVYQR